MEKSKETWYAVTGVLSEYDSSLFALQLAPWLSCHYKKPVLYLDCTRENVLEMLQSFQVEEQTKAYGFVLEQEGITIAKRVAPQEIKGWRGRGYEYIVCDFGKQSSNISECAFSTCFLVGAITKWTIEQWKREVALLPTLQKIGIALIGGEKTLAQEVFGERCCIQNISTYFVPFQLSKLFSRQVRCLLK